MSTTLSTLQDLILPDVQLCTEHDLYLQLEGPAGYSESTGQIICAPGGKVSFATYFNLFSLGKWVQQCDLKDLQLALWGKGRLEITVTMARENRSWLRLYNDVVTLKETAATHIDLSAACARRDPGPVYFSLTALDEGVFRNAAWQTRQPRLRTPDLLLSVTTFRREEAVRKTVRRFENFIATSPLKDHVQLLVVDNGKSAGIVDSAHVRSVDNANLGGAGGFARGLLEARDRSFSHCLFMDDDAAVHMSSLERTWQFLAYATDPATAVAGALTMAAHSWTMWENGAVFDQRCIPLHQGTDLREMSEVIGIELATMQSHPKGHYGGWWYFAFPVNHATYMPFPFFVRGDDVSFGLANDFNIQTLPGVASFQDADFSDKESAQTLYLDMRSHLAHHLALPHMYIGATRTTKIALWFSARSLLTCHYETLAAQNLAILDTLRGPEFFAEMADMAQRRADVAALRKTEIWRPLEGPPPPERLRINPESSWQRALMKLTMNGLLLPFFGSFGNHIVLYAHERGNIRRIWGAAQITYINADRTETYTVRHSKWRGLLGGLRLALTSTRFWISYPSLRVRWSAGYKRIATEAFWRKALKFSKKA